jgi:effector-binding domain-containing protein
MPDSDSPVSVTKTTARGIAAVRVRLPIKQVPSEFPRYLNQVYAAGREGTVQLDGQNIFVYRNVPGSDTEVNVEFGVGVNAPFPDRGSVAYSELPVGDVATATCWGDYSGLTRVHSAVKQWCLDNSRKLAGPRWEIYGHWSDDPSKVRTDVFYLLD